jgi:hypothetical protein
MSVAETPWEPRVTDRLRTLIASGNSYGQTAKALNREFGTAITRNAVCSKVDRLDLNKQQGPSAPKLRAPEVKPQGHCPLGNITRAGFGKPAPEEAPRKSAPPDSIATAPKPIHDCGFSHSRCKWPLMARDAAGDLRLCQNASDRRTYCAEHARYATTATMPKAARDAQEATRQAHISANKQANPRHLTFSKRAAA